MAIATMTSTLLLLCSLTLGVKSMAISEDRGERLIFNLVRFQNAPCGVNNEIGTCYTTDECASRGGSARGPCASGYGTCCVFTTQCGGIVNENSTTLAVSAATEDCTYTICKCSDNICRIRLDFNSFVLDGPTAGMEGPSFGDCQNDRFSITSSLSTPPVICGFNTGQHMIIDAGDGCETALFNINEGQMMARMWDITVTQFACGDEFAGPSGCLQYFTSPMGMVKSFNYNTFDNSVHLSDQDYNMCFRRESGNCRICYAATAPGMKESFGLSVSADVDGPESDIDSNCKTDYLVIPSGTLDTTSKVKDVGTRVTNKFCGRFLNFDVKKNKGATVCSFSVPFRLRFVSDGGEMLVKAAPNTNENNKIPSGTLGFELAYKQFPCV